MLFVHKMSKISLTRWIPLGPLNAFKPWPHNKVAASSSKFLVHPNENVFSVR